MSFDWKANFPYPNPREIQAQSLQELADNWNDYDIFVLSAPTAYGKSAFAKTLMNALRSVSVVTPTNLLVDQFLSEFPDTPTLHRLDSYYCEKWDRPCSITRGKCRNFCNRKRDDISCPASADLSVAKFRRGPGVYNYYTYMAHRLYRDVLVVDEAHNLLPVIRDRLALRIWQHDYRYPHNMWSYEHMRQWLGTLSAQKQKHQKIELLREAITYDVPRYIVQRTQEEFNGKGTIRGEPEMRDCLKLLPVDISEAPPIFWPYREVKKVVLMSATIGPKDIEQLGLRGRRRVLYIDCKSPIPSGNRPIIPLCPVSVNRGNIEQAADILAEEIDRLALEHKGEKGVIHATYQMAKLLASRLQGDRYMFHDRDSKKEQYLKFRDAPATDAPILVASGMYEGIDLPEDLGRWQVISKIPWQSLGNPAVAHLAKLDPEWYIWETVKTVIQACGRICRTPTDYGVTYILDKSFWRMYKEGNNMIPDWFQDAIVGGSGDAGVSGSGTDNYP